MSSFSDVDFSPLRKVDLSRGLFRIGRIHDGQIEDVRYPGYAHRFKTMSDFRSWCCKTFKISKKAEMLVVTRSGGEIAPDSELSFFDKGMYVIRFVGESVSEVFAIAVPQ